MGLIKDGSFYNARRPLLQRVTAGGRTAVFSFGGGGSGLSEEAQAMVNPVFSWDYMGAAEFERGEAANCLAFMFENQPKLVCHEAGGYSFLVREDVKDEAAEFFLAVVKGKIEDYHGLGLKNPKVLGWFDFHNGYFVSREPALRDAVKKMLDEAAANVQT